MKVKVTIISENDKHCPDKASKEKIESIVKSTWINTLNMMGANIQDIKEIKCELLER